MVNGVSTLPVPNHPIGGRSTATAARLAHAPIGFVAGDENRLLAAVIRSWCDVLGGLGKVVDTDQWPRLVSPLVLVGPTGSGKSHLAAGLAEISSDQQACLTTVNDLRHEFADAIERGEAGTWREALATVPVLVIDDLDHLPSRSGFQQELLHLVRESALRGHKLIVTSAQPVAHLPGWLPDLVNWFASGITLEIAPLGTAVREELIAQLATTNDWQFSDEALRILLEHSSPEPREMFALAADIQRQFGQGARFEADTLAHYLNRRKAAHAPELREIIRVVSRYYQVPLKMLTSASRQAAIVGARATAIYLARSLTDCSYEQIGQQLGGRDHTTIMHSHRQIRRRIGRETALRSAIDELTRILKR